MNIARKHIIRSMRRYPSIYPNRDYVLRHILLCNGTGYEWRNGKPHQLEEKRKFHISKETAEMFYLERRIMNYTYYVGWAPIFNIPDDVHEDWLDVIHTFAREITEISTPRFRSIMKVYYFVYYGLSTKEYVHADKVDRAVSEFIVLKREVIKQVMPRIQEIRKAREL